MIRKNGKTYIKKERKWSVIITLISLLIAGIVIAVLELLPNNVSELGYSEQNGLGRAFMYPFVFVDGQDQLYVMKEDNSVISIDNNTSAVLHDSSNNKIYYIRNTMLYEYSLKNNDRIALCDNVQEFKMLGNRRGIVYTDMSNRLLIYLFKGKEIVLLIEEPAEEAPYYTISNEGVLYSENNNLNYCDYFGKSTVISENIDSSKKFYISQDSKNICYIKENNLIISKTDGKILQTIKNGLPIVYQEETAILYPSTNELSSNEGITFAYFLSDVENNGETYEAAKLQYFSRGKLKQIATNVHRIIHYSQEDNFLIYGVINGEKMDIYITSKGEKPHKQITCDIEDSFLFDNRTDFLYYKDINNILWRYDIYDMNHKKAKIAENVGEMYDYYNKPFIAYTDVEGEYVYLVLKDKIERTDAEYDIRLYGRNHESYLLCRQNINGLMTLDYVFEDRLTRIANNVSSEIFFDRDMEYAIYNENQRLFLWHSGEIILIGEYDAIKAVDII